MLTKSDIAQLKEIFVTKDEFREMTEYFTMTFATKQEMMAGFSLIMEELRLIRQEVQRHTIILNEHTRILAEHSKILALHSQMLLEHSRLLRQINDQRLDERLTLVEHK